MRPSWYALILVMGLGSLAAASEKAAETGLEAVAKSLNAADRQNGVAIASALKGSLLFLKDAPPVHTRTFTARLGSEEERKRALEQTEAMERFLLCIGEFAEPLSRAEDSAFEDAMRSLVELRDRLAGPGSYGNIVAGVGLTQFVARLSLHRIFAHPGTAQSLQPTITGNQRGAVPPWEVLAQSLHKETAGVVQLKLKTQSPLRERLMELLREAKRLGDAVDLELAERDGPYWGAAGAIMRGTDPSLVGIPSNLDHVFLPGLLVNLASADTIACSAAWWGAWAQTHSPIPEEFGEFAQDYDKKTQGQPMASAFNAVTGKTYEARDMYVFWSQRQALVFQAKGILSLGPFPPKKNK